MPQIMVKFRDPQTSWGLVELQGSVECPPNVALQGAHIGDLHMDKAGVPHLVVGHHVLTGKVMTLDKPFAVMRKSTENEKEWNVVSVVERKYMFKTRPKPIIQKK